MVRNSNTCSKARLEDADRSRQYPMICTNSISPSVDARRERLCEQSQQRQARYRERCQSTDLTPSTIFQSLPTDHVFVFVSSYPVRDCTPYLCTPISLVQKDASHPHRPCRPNKEDCYRPTGLGPRHGRGALVIYTSVFSGHMPTLGLECVDPLAGLAEMAPTRV